MRRSLKSLKRKFKKDRWVGIYVFLLLQCIISPNHSRNVGKFLVHKGKVSIKSLLWSYFHKYHIIFYFVKKNPLANPPAFQLTFLPSSIDISGLGGTVTRSKKFWILFWNKSDAVSCSSKRKRTTRTVISSKSNFQALWRSEVALGSLIKFISTSVTAALMQKSMLRF